eukprot:scpid67145/ scgid0873/ WW domain-containing oxidoreductase
MGARQSFPTVDLSGRVAIVTGANSGTGYETTKALARMGAKVIMACRSQSRAEQAMERMRKELPSQTLDVAFVKLDLASMSSTVQCAEQFMSEHDHLHILCCNAGIIGHQFELTEDKVESVFQTNYLCHFLLIARLVPAMAKCGADARIVSVSSTGHVFVGNMATGKTNSREAFNRLGVYANTKLYQVMMTAVLQRRLQDTCVTVTSVHPGDDVHEEIGSQAWLDGFTAVGRLPSPAKAAVSIIYACVSPQLAGHPPVFMAKCRPYVESVEASNKSKQEELFDYSVRLLREHIGEEGARVLGIDLATVSSPEQTRLPASQQT